MPISVNSRMGDWDLIEILENIVFWVLVVYIAFYEKQTPSWVFIFLFLYVIYFGLRTIFRKKGMDRVVWLYSLNMLVILYLFMVFTRK